jgi:hypothetical protein
MKHALPPHLFLRAVLGALAIVALIALVSGSASLVADFLRGEP